MTEPILNVEQVMNGLLEREVPLVSATCKRCGQVRTLVLKTDGCTPAERCLDCAALAQSKGPDWSVLDGLDFSEGLCTAGDPPPLTWSPLEHDGHNEKSDKLSARRYAVQTAKKVCADCPILQMCRTAILEAERGLLPEYRADEVWGGLTKRERMKLDPGLPLTA